MLETADCTLFYMPLGRLFHHLVSEREKEWYMCVPPPPLMLTRLAMFYGMSLKPRIFFYVQKNEPLTDALHLVGSGRPYNRLETSL
jgi:hypothetical protein